MSHAVLITVESIAQRTWRRTVGAQRRQQLFPVVMLAGYAWTLACFCWTLPPHVMRLVDAGIYCNGSPEEMFFRELGSRHATEYLL